MYRGEQVHSRLGDATSGSGRITFVKNREGKGGTQKAATACFVTEEIKPNTSYTVDCFTIVQEIAVARNFSNTILRKAENETCTYANDIGSQSSS